MTLILDNDGEDFFCDNCGTTIPRFRSNPFPEHNCPEDKKPMNYYEFRGFIPIPELALDITLAVIRAPSKKAAKEKFDALALSRGKFRNIRIWQWPDEENTGDFLRRQLESDIKELYNFAGQINEVLTTLQSNRRKQKEAKAF